MEKESGFREIEHTADWELEVWAPNLSALFEQAAHGMAAISGTRLDASPRRSRTLELQAQDAEGLLVSFLSELLYLGESEGLGFDSLQLSVDANRLTASIETVPIASFGKEIKAVTYHHMKIRDTEGGLKVNVVFDV